MVVDWISKLILTCLRCLPTVRMCNASGMLYSPLSSRCVNLSYGSRRRLLEFDLTSQVISRRLGDECSSLAIACDSESISRPVRILNDSIIGSEEPSKREGNH